LKKHLAISQHLFIYKNLLIIYSTIKLQL